MSNARDFALFVLDSKQLPNWRANSLARKFAQSITEPADPRDRALAGQLEVGVVKNLLQLQYWIQEHSGRPLAKVHPLLQKILAIAIYQIRFLDRIRPATAVDEAVEQTKKFGMAHARGFANAVLRKAADSRTSVVPTSDDPAQMAERLLSHPAELYEKLARAFDADTALAICRHDNIEPPTILRLARGKTLADVRTAIDATQSKAVISELPEQDLFILAPADKALLALLGAQSIAQVQDPTSAKVLANADLKPNQSFLDRCCGLGTKTLQAWQTVGASANIVAIDPSAARCQTLLNSLMSAGITNVRVIQSSTFPRGNPDFPQKFDRILIDVPCSNSGVLARRPEARYAQDASTLAQLRELQQKIIKDTIPCLTSGGKLIYSTCSIWREENQDITQWMLREFPQLTLIREELTLPSSGEDPTKYHDGGYFAILSAR